MKTLVRAVVLIFSTAQILRSTIELSAPGREGPPPQVHAMSIGLAIALIVIALTSIARDGWNRLLGSTRLEDELPAGSFAPLGKFFGDELNADGLAVPEAAFPSQRDFVLVDELYPIEAHLEESA